METNDWHAGFASAIPLELKDYEAELGFDSEHILNLRPIKIDFIVLKKKHNFRIDKNFGKIFRKYNIFEYKSPRAALNIDVLFKANAYACLYKAYTDSVNEIKRDDITLTLVRDIKPVGLFEELIKDRYSVENVYQGIYYIYGEQFFPTQVVVGSELSEDDNIWFKSLTEKADVGLVDKFIDEAEKRRDSKYDEYLKTLMRVVATANKDVFNKAREGKKMLTFEEICGVKEEIDEYKRQIEEKDISLMEKDSLIEKLMRENAALRQAQ